ncbi:transcriptional regulator [Allostella sp. ATCC 35155]|nr:transcriptional regulator [Stella sp. ATCC 35155]
MRYRFGPFELAEETRELRADGQPRAVEPQVFDLLRFLIQARDRVVSQDDLIDAVWNRRIVSDAAISARISAARTAIDDDGRRQRWIRTIPRRGFRFVGDVTTTSEGSDAAALDADAGQRRQRVAFCRSRDGTRIAFAVSGNGPPLVKAGHWLTHLDHDWQSPIWAPILDRLGQRFRLVRYDQRGNGLSDWDIGPLSLDRFVDDLEAVVDAAGLGRFALYGTSQGVPIAIAFACRHPDRVSRLVLHGGFEKGRLLRMAESERAQAEAILTLMRLGWGRPGNAFIDAFATMFIPDGNREQIESLVDLQHRTTSPENAVALRVAVDQFDVSDRVEHVQAPTLVIHSQHDAVQPLDQGRQVAARIPGAEFLLLDSRNHVVLPQEKDWPRLFERLERFLLE